MCHPLENGEVGFELEKKTAAGVKRLEFKWIYFARVVWSEKNCPHNAHRFGIME